MYFVKTPKFFRWVFPKAIWKVNTSEKYIYLTFDDGPDPSSTPTLLDLLAKHNVKATFFIQGAKAKEHPLLVERMLKEGHVLGFHGNQHLDARKLTFQDFITNSTAEKSLPEFAFFRPPYGRLTWKQYHHIKEQYRLVFWTLMPGDFDSNVDIQSFNDRLHRHTSPGSIIVLHDNSSAITKLKSVLPHYFDEWKNKEYTFEVLD